MQECSAPNESPQSVERFSRAIRLAGEMSLGQVHRGKPLHHRTTWLLGEMLAVKPSLDEIDIIAGILHSAFAHRTKMRKRQPFRPRMKIAELPDIRTVARSFHWGRLCVRNEEIRGFTNHRILSATEALASAFGGNYQAWRSIVQSEEFPKLSLVAILDIAIELSPRWLQNVDEPCTDGLLSYCKIIDEHLEDCFLKPLADYEYAQAPEYVSPHHASQWEDDWPKTRSATTLVANATLNRAREILAGRPLLPKNLQFEFEPRFTAPP